MAQGRHPGKAAGPAGDRVPLDENAVHHVVETQGGHGQVVPRKPQGGDPEDQGHDRHGESGKHHGRPGWKAIGGGEDGRTVGAQAEKGGMTQGDLAGEADEQVEPQNHDDVETDEVEDAQVVWVAHDQGGERQEQGQSPHHEPRVVADDKEFGFFPPTHGQRLPTFGVGT